MSVHISACWPFPWTDPCTDFGQLMHHDAFGRDLCTCGLYFIGQSEILGGGSNRSDKGLNLSGSWQQGHSATYNTPSHVPPQPKSPPDNVLRPDRPAEASLGSKRRGCYPTSDSRTPTYSTPLNRIPLVRTSSELAVRRPGKAPERAVPSPSPGRHEAVRSRHVSSSSSPPTVDGFGTGTPKPSPQSQSFSRNCFPACISYGSILPTSLAYIVPSTRGCSPWRPEAVMSTTGRERHSVLRIFKGHRECTGHHAMCGFAATAAPSYSSRPGSCPDGRYRCGPPPEFPLASPRSGIVHHLSGPDRHAHTRTLLRRSRSVGCAPVRDPANQLPCTLRVYSPVDSHTCQTPWSVFQDGSNGEPIGRRPEHADAKARREAHAADHD
ncbi:unnamed protein product [Brassica rapa subsp. narinosa]